MRISYDYLFLAKTPFLYKEQMIAELTITIEFQVFKNNIEIPIADEIFKISINGEKYYINQFLNCSIDNENGFKLTLKENLLKNTPYNIKYKITDTSKGFFINNWEKKPEYEELVEETKKILGYCGNMTDVGFIELTEFIHLLKSNFDTFNTRTNISCQVPSYSIG